MTLFASPWVWLVKPMVFQQIWRDLPQASACGPKIDRVHTFWRIVFLLWSNEISTFFVLLMHQGAHIVAGHAFGFIFGELVFCVGLTKYQQFWFFNGFVCCIGRPLDDQSWALWNHRQIENVKIAQGFSLFLGTRSNHIEWSLPTMKHSWAFWNHRTIENYWNYTRFFIYFSNHIGRILRTLQNSWPPWNHRKVDKC